MDNIVLLESGLISDDANESMLTRCRNRFNDNGVSIRSLLAGMLIGCVLTIIPAIITRYRR